MIKFLSKIIPAAPVLSLPLVGQGGGGEEEEEEVGGGHGGGLGGSREQGTSTTATFQST